MMHELTVELHVGVSGIYNNCSSVLSYQFYIIAYTLDNWGERSEPHTNELAGGYLICMYVCMYGTYVIRISL